MPLTEEKVPSLKLNKLASDQESDIVIRPAEEILGMKRVVQSANPTGRHRQPPIFTKDERATLESRTGRINS